eukprot:12932386-Prorocentrum_lima.AAC.1
MSWSLSGCPIGWPNWKSYHPLTSRELHMMPRDGIGTTIPTKMKLTFTKCSDSKAGFRTRMPGWKRAGLSMHMGSASESVCFGNDVLLGRFKT